MFLASPEKPRLPVVFAMAFYLLILARTAWITDDALITLRTVRNLLNGFGPVWNMGERVQAYTHPLWMLTLSGVIGATGEYYYTVLFTSIFFALLATLLTALRHAPTWPAAILAILLLSFSKAYGDYSTSGLENPLTHLLLATFYLVYFRDNQTPRTLLLAAFVASLGVLNRMDIGLIYLPPLLYSAWQVRSWRGLAALAVGCLPWAAWEIFSLFYYGFPFPNTAYAKLNTGISSGERVYQGWLYLLRSTTTDPMTGFIIVAALALALVDSAWKGRWLCAGIVLYLLYIVRIGGDYTLGRFLSAPVLCAVVYLARQPLVGWGRTTSLAAILLAILVGLMPYRQSALFVDGNTPADGIDNKGIADERKMLLSLSLLESNRFNRFYESGIAQGWNEPLPFMAGAIGRIGFAASSYTHIVDVIGLADPLIARLPARYDPGWRPGHPVRVMPEGYLLTQRAGKNLLADENLARYYDKLKLIISGDLLDRQRLLEIWRFNRGVYDAWIDRDRYRFPERLTLPSEAISRAITQTVTLKSPVEFKHDGLLVRFGEVQHAPLLEIGVDLDRFVLVYFHGQERLHEQFVAQTPIRLGGQVIQVVKTPAAVVSRGYTDVHLYPRIYRDYKHAAYPAELTHNDYTLTFFDPIALTEKGYPLHPEQLAELYFFEYFQGEKETRSDLLAQWFTQLQQADAERWAQVPTEKLFELSQLPEPAVSELFRVHLSVQATLTEATGRPVLHYLGALVMPTNPHARYQGIQFKFYFQVLDKISQKHSLWFHIASNDTDHQWMVYDYFAEEETDRWPVGAYYEFPVELQMEPGSYDISFGFWTRERERLYVDVKSDTYWINLGAHLIPGLTDEENIVKEKVNR